MDIRENVPVVDTVFVKKSRENGVVKKESVFYPYLSDWAPGYLIGAPGHPIVPSAHQ